MFSGKSVQCVMVRCPVELQIFDESDNLVMTLENGPEQMIHNEIGQFYIVPEEDGDDYIKMAYLYGDGYTAKAVGLDAGEMDVEVAAADKNGDLICYSISNLPVSGSSVSVIPLNFLKETPVVKTDLNGDGVFEVKNEMQLISGNIDRPSSSQTGGGSGSDDSSVEVDSINAQNKFWDNVVTAINKAKHGSSIKVTVGEYSAMPKAVITSLCMRNDISLQIVCNDSRVITIPANGALYLDSDKEEYRFEELELIDFTVPINEANMSEIVDKELVSSNSSTVSSFDEKNVAESVQISESVTAENLYSEHNTIISKSEVGNEEASETIETLVSNNDMHGNLRATCIVILIAVTAAGMIGWSCKKK